MPNDTLLAIDRADVERIKRAAEAAGLDALGLYNIIRQAAGGAPRQSLEDPAACLARQWPQMPQSLAAPVLAAIADHAGAGEAAIVTDEAVAQPSERPAAAPSRTAPSETLATPGDVTRIMALAAETNTTDTELLNLVLTLSGRQPAATAKQAARRLPGELQRLPLRFVPGLMDRLRPSAPQSTSDISPERPDGAGPAIASVPFDAAEPQHQAEDQLADRGESGHAPIAA
jgi:hypothetical protein